MIPITQRRFLLYLFFFHNLSSVGIDAFVYGNLGSGTEQTGVYCPRKLATGETWRTTNLQLVRTFEIIANSNKDIKVLTADARQIVILSSISLSVYKYINTDCEGTQSGINFFYRAALIAAKINGVEALACIGNGTLSIDVDCCE